jgi:hypothetical protein
VYNSILGTQKIYSPLYKIYSPRRPGTRDLCTREYNDYYDGGGGDDSECDLNSVVGMYEFLTPRDFCTFPDNDYGTCTFSFGYFPGVRLSFADVSEPSVRSIFKGWMISFHLIHKYIFLYSNTKIADGPDRWFRNVGKT